MRVPTSFYRAAAALRHRRHGGGRGPARSAGPSIVTAGRSPAAAQVPVLKLLHLAGALALALSCRSLPEDARGTRGVHLREAAETTEARAQYERSQRRAAALAKVDPNHTKRDLAERYKAAGEFATQNNDLPPAVAQFELYSQLQEALERAVQQELATTEMARVQIPRDVPVSDRERSHQAPEKLAKADPTGAQAQRDLAVSLEKLGELELQAGNLATARMHFEGSLQVREGLAKADPTSAQAQQDLAVSLEHLGGVEMRAGDLKPAQAHFERSLQLAEGQAKADPTNAQVSFNVVLSHCLLAQLAMQRKRREPLRKHLEAANVQLTEMDHQGQVTGVTQREQVLVWVQDMLAELAPREHEM